MVDSPGGIQAAGDAAKPADTPASATPSKVVKMPAEESAELKKMEGQLTRLQTENKDLVTAYRDYEQRITNLRSSAALLITRAALKAKLTLDQLDSSDLAWDEKSGSFEWRPRPIAAATPPLTTPETHK